MVKAVGAVWSAAEKRKYRRFRLKCPVRLRFSSEDPSSGVDTVSRNVSIGGLFLEWPLPIPDGRAVEFTITLQGRSILRPILLVGTGEVVRVETGKPKDEFSIAIACSQPITEIEHHFSAAGG
jgi:PilZ domain